MHFEKFKTRKKLMDTGFNLVNVISFCYLCDVAFCHFVPSSIKEHYC